MTDKELMQQALDALEMYWVKAEHLRTKVDDAQARQAVFALQARLGQTEDVTEINFGHLADEPVAIKNSCSNFLSNCLVNGCLPVPKHDKLSGPT